MREGLDVDETWCANVHAIWGWRAIAGNVTTNFAARAFDCHVHLTLGHFETLGENLEVVNERFHRLVDSRAWDGDRRMEDMDDENVVMQAVSPMPELLGYWIDANSALTLARQVNESIAEMVRKQPGRFRGLGMAHEYPEVGLF